MMSLIMTTLNNRSRDTNPTKSINSTSNHHETCAWLASRRTYDADKNELKRRPSSAPRQERPQDFG